jgi:hypothetical protein
MLAHNYNQQFIIRDFIDSAAKRGRQTGTIDVVNASPNPTLHLSLKGGRNVQIDYVNHVFLVELDEKYVMCIDLKVVAQGKMVSLQVKNVAFNPHVKFIWDGKNIRLAAHPDATHLQSTWNHEKDCSCKYCKKPSCRSFVKDGNCQFGDKCNFDHTIPSKANLHEQVVAERKTKKSPCFRFAQGLCQFGDKCRYQHTGPITSDTADGPAEVVMEKKDPSIVQVQAVSVTKKPCFKFSTKTCKFGDKCRYSHDQDAISTIIRICKYAQVGTCKKGDKCEFKHVSSSSVSNIVVKTENDSGAVVV